VIVSALGAHCEEFVAGARQDHVVIAHAPEQHAAGLERRDRNSVGKTRRLRVL
jgi:hypothetical protein